MEYSKCSCGAITVDTEEGQFSMPEELFEARFGDIDDHELVNEYGNCNHCVNHWGIDICACGSGEPFAECDGGFDVCGNPMQVMETGQVNVKAEDSWI